MNEPDWTRVLKALYEGQLVVSDKLDLGVKYELMEFLSKHGDLADLSEKDIENILESLSHVGLVEAVGVSGNLEREEGESERIGGLTPDGFKTAHDWEMKQQQESHDRIIGAFTVLVGISALIQAVPIVDTKEGTMQLILGFIAVSGALAFYLVLNGRHNVFTN